MCETKLREIATRESLVDQREKSVVAMHEQIVHDRTLIEDEVSFLLLIL